MTLDVRFRPLERWPLPSTPRDQRRRRHTFRMAWNETLALLEKELGYLDARDVVIEVALQPGHIRLDGWPRADAPDPSHPGVAISFASKHGPLRYLTDTHEWWRHNVHAIALGLQALRAVDRYGITHRAEQYQGWAALPPATSGAVAAAVGVLARVAGEEPADDLSVEERLSLYRRALKVAHPDQGGTAERFAEVREAGRVLGVVTDR